MTQRKFRPWTFALIAMVHTAAAYAVFYGMEHGYSLSAWFTAGVFYTLAAAGTSLGNHRLFSHGSFKCGPVTARVLSALGALACQGPLKRWVPDHEVHHRFADAEGDPHRPGEYPGLRGFLWAHCGWLLFETRRPAGWRSTFLASEKGRAIVAWEDVWYWPIAIGGFAVPLIFGGVSFLLLAGFGRVVLGWHVTWSVNSFCHVFGHKPETLDGRYFSRDQSRNNWGVGLFAWIGEWLHGYHHAQADCAYFGWKWYHADLGKWTLIVLERFGIVWDVVKPRKGAIAA